MSRTKPIWLWLALLGLAWLGWRVLSLGLADHYAQSQPERALFWRDDHPEALLRAAELAAQDPAKADLATDYARRALRSDPLDGRPYRILAQLADAAGDKPRALELFQIAAHRAPRDPVAHLWLMDHHLRGNRPAELLAHLDLLLRMYPRTFAQHEPLLLALAAAPPAHDALAVVLADQPPWRHRFLATVATKAPDTGAVAPLFDAVRRQQGGLAGNELAPWLDRLVREGRAGQAYLLWAANLPPERQRSLGNVFNGGFEFAPDPVGFDWRFGRVPGARIERLGGSGVGGQSALRVAFEHRRVPFAHVRQMLALAPGRYQLSLRARADGLRSERGLVWQVSCVAGGRLLGQTDPLRGQTPWHRTEMQFEVPADCPGQWLLLRVPARIEAEQQIGGRAWFDDLVIRRLP